MTDTTHQDYDVFKRLISEISELGARSVGFGGGGDPSMYPHLAEALRYVKAHGLDIGMYTNGNKLNEDCLEAIIDCCTWIRISIDADGPAMYEIAHGVSGKNFYEVINNIERLVEKRKKKQSGCTIGSCYLIGPKTKPGVYNAIKLCRDLGLVHIRIRPYFQKPGDNRTRIDIDETISFLEKCKELETDTFKVSFPNYRVEWMDQKNRIRNYNKCFAIHLDPSITPDGNVYSCCHFKNNPSMAIGNIHEQSFKEIWNSRKRKIMNDKIDFTYCPNPCNFEKHNELLWDIINSGLSLEQYLEKNKVIIPQLEGIHKNFL